MQNLPKAVREEIIKINDLKLKVFILGNGQRVIDEESMQKFLDYMGLPNNFLQGEC